MNDKTSGAGRGLAISSAYAGRVPFDVKLAFGVGAISEFGINAVFNVFSFFFYTNILGLSGSLVGLALSIALVIDAVSDPVVGAVSDRWRSRLGRRHPFLFLAPLPVALALYLIYAPPADLQGMALFAWLTTLTVILRLGMTCFSIPHVALGAELSADFTERSRIMSFNMLFAAVGTYGAVFLGYQLFFVSTPEFENGLMNAAAYHDFALAAALVGGAIMLLSIIGLMKVIPYLPKPAPKSDRFQLIAFLREILSVFRNRNYLALLFGYIFLGMYLGTKEALGIHMYNYYWELTPRQIQLIPIALFAGTIIAFVTTARLHARFGRTNVLRVLAALGILLGAAPVGLRVLGLFPENHSPLLLPMLLTLGGAFIFCIIGASITVLSALADVADQHELATSKRQEGVLYSARSFFGKATSGLGAIFAGEVITATHFPVGAKAGTVPEHTIYMLGIFEGLVLTIAGLMAVLCYSRYRLSRSEYADIQRALISRHAAKSVAAET